MSFYKVRDADGVVIGQFSQPEEPTKPLEYDGEWNPEEVSQDDLNTEPVEWWDERA